MVQCVGWRVAAVWGRGGADRDVDQDERVFNVQSKLLEKRKEGVRIGRGTSFVFLPHDVDQRLPWRAAR